MSYEEYKELSERVIEVELLDEDIVKAFDYNLEWGFVWILLGDEDEGVIVQACMTLVNEVEDEDDERLILRMDYCDHLEGCCGDANEKAFKLYSEERCMKTLFHYAKENGFTVF